MYSQIIQSQWIGGFFTRFVVAQGVVTK
jgi:hypothetical protein